MDDRRGNSRLRRWSTTILEIAAILLGLAGLLAATTGGIRIEWGGLRISATDAPRLFFEASASVAAAVLLRSGPESARRTAIIALAILSVVVAAASESTPRRVGDGIEYIAMARQLGLLRPPSMLPHEVAEFNEAIRSFSGYAEPLATASDFLGSDGRHNFVHFWIYSALVAPLVALAAVLGWHWNHAFTIVNVLMLVGAFLVVSRRFGVDTGVFTALSPVVWWVDKAHPEVFFFSGLAVAVSVFVVAPALAAFVLGLLAAQNPVFAPALLVAALLTLRTRRTSPGKLLPAFAVAAIHPAYNLWHLGTVTPLSSAVTTAGMSLSNFVLPLIDPNVGIVWAAPVFFAAWLAGISRAKEQDRSVYWLCAGSASSLLCIVALSANLNHGATPGPSRYGVWLLPLILCLPLTISGGRRAGLAVALLLASVTASLVSFHPRLDENFLHVSRPVQWIYGNVPQWYDPAPEIFFERIVGHEGRGAIPIASDSCAKVLLHVRQGESTAWPIPCLPVDVPASCVGAGGLCYANGSAGATRTFSPAPDQPSFQYDDRTFGVWTVGVDLSWLPVKPEWSSFVRVPPYSERSMVKAVVGVLTVDAFQNSSTLVALVEARPGSTPRLQIQHDQPVSWYWIDWQQARVISSGTLEQTAWLEAPVDTNVVFLASHIRE